MTILYYGLKTGMDRHISAPQAHALENLHSVMISNDLCNSKSLYSSATVESTALESFSQYVAENMLNLNVTYTLKQLDLGSAAITKIDLAVGESLEENKEALLAEAWSQTFPSEISPYKIREATISALAIPSDTKTEIKAQSALASAIQALKQPE